MRIVFICGSLEPGRDGVGDYTRSLADECARLGHEVGLLALHDRHVESARRSEHPFVLRLPAAMPWTARLPVAEAFCREIAPQWISLQFVPYGFHDKGLAWQVANYLQRLTSGRRVHVMLHELWIGANQQASLKDRVIGTLQRWCVFRLLKRAAASVMHTSNAPYASMLDGMGFSVTRLPMFGSIPLIEEPDAEWIFEEIRRAGVPATQRDGLWIFCIFGTLHPVWLPEPLFEYLREAGQREGRKIVVISVGRLGPGEQLWDRLTLQYRGTIQLVKLGERSTGEVSAAFQVSDFGIATSPWQLIGKSSSAASMIEHGLPVIVNRDDVKFRTGSGAEVEDPLLVKMDAQLPALLPKLRKVSSRAGGATIAQEFLRHLEGAQVSVP